MILAMAAIGTTQLVIFGASGDLTRRKLIPALVRLEAAGQLGEAVTIIGVSRTPKSDQDYRDELAKAMPEDIAGDYRSLASRIHYHSADVTKADDVADALEEACRGLNVEIRREAEVTRIFSSNGRVEGVELADHTVVEASQVASSLDAHWTFERFLDPATLPDSFRQAVANIDYASASAKVNVALSELPNFTCLPSNATAPHHRGTIHISPTLDYIEHAFDDAKYGRPSSEPVLEITLPSSVDSSVVPEGKHLMSMFVQFAPYHLASGQSWDEVKEDFGDRCIELLGRYAPNVPNAVEHRQVLSPLDLERTYRITGGNIMQGAMHYHQLFFMRPGPGWADHRTPIKGLYLCGAASHPGGGVMGACGRNAATEILKDG